MITNAKSLNISESELIKALQDEFKVEPPQAQDEFTASWFAENVLRVKQDRGRKVLEQMVKDGKVTVRRHVQLTWGRKGPAGGAWADVYKMLIKAKGVKKKKAFRTDAESK